MNCNSQVIYNEKLEESKIDNVQKNKSSGVKEFYRELDKGKLKTWYQAIMQSSYQNYLQQHLLSMSED